jgi:tetratricopeptide (TPR) repeat protein
MPDYNSYPLLRGQKFFHNASRCAMSCAVARVQTEMPKVVRNLSGCEPLRTDKLTKYLSTLNDCAKARSHRFLGAATAKRAVTLLAVLCLGISFSRLASAEEKSQKREAELISKENSVDSSRPPGEWRSATVGQELIVHDRLRTGQDSRAAVQFGDASVLRIDELTEEEILPPQVASAKPTLNLKQGSAYFFSREKSREIHVQTPAANGAIRGTEFVVNVAANGSVSFTVLDGEVEISNSQGSTLAQSGERADVQPGSIPTKTSVTNAIDSVQWCLYYPGVLDLNDLALSPSEQDRLKESLSAYGQGDLLRALVEYPRSRVPASSGEKVYRAGLFLVAGQIQKAEDLLKQVDQNAPGREALSTLIAAVTLKEKSSSVPPQTATDWIAESYYRQSKSDIAGALQAAQRAANLDASNGFAWTRVAESQFNLGRAPEAKETLEKGLKFSPRNPAAHALHGFLFSAENNLKDAKDSFDTAIALNSALGDGWFGRGLCLIKQGHAEAGRRDLLIAAALEPNRAMFRRYLSENFNIVAAPTPTPKKVAARSEKTSRPEKTASPKPRHAQATPRPEITPARTPYAAQPIPSLQIGVGIGRGQRYTYPGPRPTRPPQSEGSAHPQQGDSSQQTPLHGAGNQRKQPPRSGKPIKMRTPPPPRVG